MAKAVLIMDMPESCFGCNFLYCDGDTNLDSCQAREKARPVDSATYEKPDWCPLRELPEKANHPAYCDNGRFDKGWNACLDMILEKKVNENVMPGTRNEKRTEGAQENEKRK